MKLLFHERVPRYDYTQKTGEYYSYEDTEYVLAGSEEPVDTDAVLRLFSRYEGYEGELFA